MADEIIDLVALRVPLPKVRFPNQTVHQLYEVDGQTERLRREVAADPSNEAKVRAVLRVLIPTASDEDWDSVTAEDVGHIYQAAMRKQTDVMALVESRRKNADGGKDAEPAVPIPPSSPTTTSRTSRRKSRGATTNPTGPSA